MKQQKEIKLLAVAVKDHEFWLPEAIGAALIYGDSFSSPTSCPRPSLWLVQGNRRFFAGEYDRLTTMLANESEENLIKFFLTSRDKISQRNWREGEKKEISRFFQRIFEILRKKIDLPEKITDSSWYWPYSSLTM
jgi:hypothetical protein